MKRMGISRMDEDSRLPKFLVNNVVYQHIPDYVFNKYKKKEPGSVFNLTPRMRSPLERGISIARMQS